MTSVDPIPGIPHKLARNSLFNVAGSVLTLPVVLLLTPYILHHLGKEQYGVWALAAVVTSYAQLSDMGMTTALVKYVAEYWTKGEIDKISSVISTAFFSFAVVGGVVTIGIFCAREFIVVNVLKIPLELQAGGRFVVGGVVVIFYINLLFIFRLC